VEQGRHLDGMDYHPVDMLIPDKFNNLYDRYLLIFIGEEG
jgi:hypothetical protein